jgi:hypothetical protein
VLEGNRSSSKGKIDARLDVDIRSAANYVEQASALRLLAGDLVGAWRLRVRPLVLAKNLKEP